MKIKVDGIEHSVEYKDEQKKSGTLTILFYKILNVVIIVLLIVFVIMKINKENFAISTFCKALFSKKYFFHVLILICVIFFIIITSILLHQYLSERKNRQKIITTLINEHILNGKAHE